MIEAEVRTYLETRILGRASPALRDDTPLAASGLLDSVASMKLVLHLEETYAIELTADELTSGALESIATIAAAVRRLRGQPSD